jgi:hypothetical protein
MAKIPSSGVIVTLDDSGGSARVITSYLMQIGGVKITQEMLTNTPYGSAWVTQIQTGIRKGEKITFSGLADTTATTGTFATMLVTDADAVPGFTRSLIINLGGGNGTVFTCEVIMESSALEPKIGLAGFTAELQPTGVCAWGN